MGYFVEAAMGGTVGEPAMAGLLHPVEPSERFGWATRAPSPGKCTYVFVPAMSGDTADALAGDAFGAFLRLGSYSDIEEAARDFRPEADHYPGHHLRDEGGAAAALSQASGGRQGIMLACDGRILLRSKEKMYVDTGDYHQSSSGSYDLEVDGTMRLATTGSDGGITISSAQNTLVLESGPDRDITISAGDGTGNITEYVNTSTTIISGTEYTVATGGHHSIFLGGLVNLSAGGTITTTAAANLYINVAGDLFVNLGFYLVSAHAIDCRVWYYDVTAIVLNLAEYFISEKDVSFDDSVTKTTLSQTASPNSPLSLDSEGDLKLRKINFKIGVATDADHHSITSSNSDFKSVMDDVRNDF